MPARPDRSAVRGYRPVARRQAGREFCQVPTPPGVQLLVDFADGFPEEPIGFRDSCTAASNVTESQVWPGRRALSTALVPCASRAGRTVVRALAAARGRARAVREQGPAAVEPSAGSVPAP